MEHVINTLVTLEQSQSGIIKELSKSEEFKSILVRASINAYKTHITDKHIMLKNALVNSAYLNIDFETKEIYINLIDSITLHHVIILKFIRDYEEQLRLSMNIRKYIIF